MTRRFVQVAVPVPLHQTFTYGLPAGLDAQPGVRVQVPFGPRRLVGLVVEPPSDSPSGGFDPKRIRDVLAVLDPAPVLGADLLALSRWLADYYHAPPGEAFLLPLPPAMSGGKKGEAREHAPKTESIARFVARPPDDARLGDKMDAALSWLETVGVASLREVRDATGADRGVMTRLETRGLVTLEQREVARDPFAAMPTTPDAAPPPTDEQAAAVQTISASFGAYRGHLLHGVTGSGKTEVYLALIDDVLARGEAAIVLVPEIALTPQLVGRFRARLGDRVAVLHSGLDPAARHEQWLRIAAGELPVVIGARSALFAPTPRLGLIVVDEEHEPSFKQDSAPRYHARDLALVRGSLAGAPVVLGSATPSLETWANVARGKLTRVTLAQRVHARPLPEVALVDLRTAEVADPDGMLSTELVTALTDTVARGEQAILFLNRRGFAAFVLCRACGARMACPACSVSYTWHRRRARLVCHYCDRVEPLPPRCPGCHDDALQEVGFGTERAEALLETLLPGARVGRMDRDTTRGQALLSLLDRFRRRELDVLVGTQMVAKGHDFPGVTLVGVLLAEQGLGMPDPRAAERTFQLLTQIAGRAGRADKPGRVLVQTFEPAHYALTYAARHDATGFLDDELARRHERALPPWAHLALLRVSGPDRDRAEDEAHRVAELLHEALRADSEARRVSVVIGPRPAIVERIAGRWRHQILLKSGTRAALHATLRRATAALDAAPLPSSVQLALDVDPLSFL